MSMFQNMGTKNPRGVRQKYMWPFGERNLVIFFRHNLGRKICLVSSGLFSGIFPQKDEQDPSKPPTCYLGGEKSLLCPKITLN